MNSKKGHTNAIKTSSLRNAFGKVQLKVCGMNRNTAEVAGLLPDYLGFIFWKGSKRNFEGNMPKLPDGIKKIGVFVDAPLDEVLEKIKTYGLDGVQLHGNESPDYCLALRTNRFSKRVGSLTIIKVFSVKDQFDFSVLAAYEEVCDYYLFDTKGKLPGGNGYVFDWSVLKDYTSAKPYFLSGGIGLENSEEITAFLNRPEAKYCHAIDVNSTFELAPGLKKIEDLKEFIEELKNQ